MVKEELDGREKGVRAWAPPKFVGLTDIWVCESG